MDYLKELSETIERLHGCKAKYLETVPITETFKGKVVWQGDVEVFEVKGHPKAKKCYAWAHKSGKQDKQTRYVTVLDLPPVVSPRTAIQAAIVAEYKEKNG